MSNFLNFNGNQGMSFKTFTASGTSYTLDKSASTNSVLVSVGGVMQQPGVDYTVSGTTLTSTSAWTAGVQVDTFIIHKPGTAPVIQDNSIDSDHYVDGSIDLAHMSSQSVDEDNLHISNAGSNGQFLSKQSGDAGGLTWAAAGGGAWEYVSQIVPNDNDALVAFTNMVASYDYLYTLEHCKIEADTNGLYAELGVSGPPYRTSNYISYTTFARAGTIASGADTARIPISYAGIGTTGDEQMFYGECLLLNPYASADTSYTSHAHGINHTPAETWEMTGGMYTTAESHVAIRFFQGTSGDIMSGTIRQYRRTNA